MPEQTDVYLRTCPLCEAMCGLKVSVTAGKVTDIRADPDDVWSQGYLCPKGTTLGHLYEDPDRLRRPLVKGDDGVHREVSWDEAFEEIERRLRPILDSDGAAAVTSYIGNPIAHNLSLGQYVGAFIGMAQAAGMTQIYSAGTVDQWPNNVASALMYGNMWAFSVPDIERCDYLLMLGANPSASQGSLLATRDIMGRLAALRKRGGKFLVVDPRRTRTAEASDEWIAIRPGTDALLLFAILHTLTSENLVQVTPKLQKKVSGLDEVLALAADFSPEDVADTCGIPAESIRRIARDLTRTQRSAVYGRIGTCTQEFGTLAQWLIETINIAIGTLDRAGGKMFPKAVTWSLMNVKPPDQPADGWEFGRWHSRVRGAPEILGQFPVSCMAEEIATPGQGRLRALITLAGNPVISAPDSAALDAALPKLDCMISVDNSLNETTRHAHVILPGLSPLEQGHHDDLLWQFAVRSAARWSDPVFEPEAGRPAEWQILLRLAGAMLGMPANEDQSEALDEAFFTGVVGTLVETSYSPIAGRDAETICAETSRLSPSGPERMLDLIIRMGPFGDDFGNRPGGLTLAEVKKHPHGLDLGELQEHRLDDIIQTPSGKIELIHKHLTNDVARLRESLNRERPAFVLTSRRHLRSNNSWMHNTPSLLKGRDRCTLLIHPDDAARVGVSNGAKARVRSTAGEVVVAAEVSDEMMPGVVSLPHGWGHDRPGTRMSVAATRPGVNSNLLNPGTLVDVPSGNAIVNGVPVEISPA
jgi:anaerobic selenocysteine-containing dehydrogenase